MCLPRHLYLLLLTVVLGSMGGRNEKTKLGYSVWADEKLKTSGGMKGHGEGVLNGREGT